MRFHVDVEPATLLDPMPAAAGTELTDAAVATTGSEEGVQVATLEGLPAGRYRLTVAPGEVGAANPRPVTAVFEVAG